MNNIVSLCPKSLNMFSSKDDFKSTNQMSYLFTSRYFFEYQYSLNPSCVLKTGDTNVKCIAPLFRESCFVKKTDMYFDVTVEILTEAPRDNRTT